LKETCEIKFVKNTKLQIDS